MKKHTLSFNVRRLVMLSLLVAAEIVFNRFLSVNTAGVKIGFSFVPIVIAAYLFGPVYAGAAYAVADLMGAILFPIGPYHPGFTVCAFLMGVCYGLFLYKKREISLFKNILPPVLINSIFFGLLINTVWVSMLYGRKTYGGWFIHRLLTEYSILIPVSLLLIPSVIGICRLIDRRIGGRDGRRRGGMTYGEALEYIHGVNWTFCKPGLDRIRELCEGLGNPQDSLRFVHVVGTNGKGSFCSMLSSVLSEAGYKTGLYTSPYVVRFNERMSVDGVNISDERLAEITEAVKPIADRMSDKPTEFELITAIAFEYFRREGCDIVVLEAGLGGRLDSTNIIKNPYLSVITGIALDHTAYLGDTVGAIAAEKAGVIKDGAPVLFGGCDPEALAVIERFAEERGSRLFLSDYGSLQIKRENLEGTLFSAAGYEDMEISLLGGYQPRNATTVLCAVNILKEAGLILPEEAIRKGLCAARWPARFEIVAAEPLTIFDGAHNPEGISAAVESISLYFPNKKVVAVTGVLGDKDYRFIAGRLAEAVGKAYTITPDNPRALSAEDYAEVLKKCGVDAVARGSMREALKEAIEYAARSGLPVVVLGSLYTYSDLLSALADEKGV